MTASNIRQEILEYIETLPGEEVKTLLLTWLTRTSASLEDFERLVANQAAQTTEDSFEYGDIKTALNFQPLTEAEMVQQSKTALETYQRKGSGVAHNRVREWVDSLGTEQERPCPK
ncbi:hypothetical protein [Nostoc sp. UHCC 0252]|uniref:hypothetical protein n=1 Tax=Nostoc sp. UHCC 0252 TaxID=3110241 RepID=UPI002B1FE8F6|nr:hypothetical protein [Nostoc sp. UHCC 0252]MEA5604882.1 hypothetical protein [Nostoc sp. UHCC 0252]